LLLLLLAGSSTSSMVKQNDALVWYVPTNC